MGHRSKKAPYEQFRRLAEQAIERSELLASVRDVVENVGYGRDAAKGWAEAGACPESAIWAMKGLLQQLPDGEEKRIEFTVEELTEIVAVLPTDNPLLIQKAIKAMRQGEQPS